MIKLSRYTLIVFATVLFTGLLIPQTMQAQMGVGASYEIRNEDPRRGFGVRIEKNIFKCCRSSA